MNEKKELELYIHIPFCMKKCSYCDFLSAPANKQVQKEYHESLLAEIYHYKKNLNYPIGDYKVSTIFFGGGTPSSIEESYIKEILEGVYKVFSCEKTLEITIEVNPGTLTGEKLKTYYDSGINRLSFGLQSAHNEELALLGRLHRFEEFEENFIAAREIGFHNINIDLMSGLPEQKEKDWENSLRKIVELNPEHISAYSLMIEEGTPFFNQFSKHPEQLPEEETERNMYYFTKRFLEENGYKRYEISNYAKKEYECKHNLGYWSGTSYLGLGLGASSLFENHRFSNENDLKNYLKWNGNLKLIHGEKKYRSQKEEIEEFMFLGLRKTDGIRKEEFKKRFSRTVDQVYGENIEKLKKKGLIAETKEWLYLTSFGIDVSNVVLSDFLIIPCSLL